MRIGGEKLEIHPFSCDKKEQYKYLFLRDKVLSHWRVIHCVKGPEKTVNYQTEDESACTISNILPAPKKYIQSADGQMTTSNEVVAIRTLNEAMGLHRDGRCRRPNTGNAISHILTENKHSR